MDFTELQTQIMLDNPGLSAPEALARAKGMAGLEYAADKLREYAEYLAVNSPDGTVVDVLTLVKNGKTMHLSLEVSDA